MKFTWVFCPYRNERLPRGDQELMVGCGSRSQPFAVAREMYHHFVAFSALNVVVIHRLMRQSSRGCQLRVHFHSEIGSLAETAVRIEAVRDVLYAEVSVASLRPQALWVMEQSNIKCKESLVLHRDKFLKKLVSCLFSLSALAAFLNVTPVLLSFVRTITEESNGIGACCCEARRICADDPAQHRRVPAQQ
jgi:hypothetical protein